MKKILALLAVSVLGVHAGSVSALTVEQPTQPYALIVRVNKKTGETETFQVNKNDVNLKNKQNLAAFVQNLDTEATKVDVVLDPGEELGESALNPAWGWWGYHQSYFWWNTGSYWNFPTYAWNFGGVANWYHPWGSVSWGGYWNHCYFPRWW
jgi:hypothetical protein